MHTRLPCTLLALTVLAVSASASASSTPEILAASGFGDDLGGEPIALELAADGTTLLLSRDPQGLGALLRLDPFGAASGPARPLSERADDLAIDRRTGNLSIVGDTELVTLGPDLTRLWHYPLPPRRDGEPGRRVAVGELGTVAVLAAGELHTVSATGLGLGRVASAGQSLRDLAVVDATGVVVVTGSSARTLCEQAVDVAVLSAFAFDGTPRWRADDRAQTEDCEHQNLASARGVAVARGGDGHVYLLAEVDGATNQFRGPAEQPAANVAFDTYTAPEAGQAALYAYYARYSADGDHVLGQYFALPDAGSVVRPRAIAADRHGNVYFTGSASHSLGAAGERVYTERLDAMAGFYQVVEPDFEARRVWHQAEADDMTTALSALAIAEDRAVSLLQAETLPGRSEAGALPAGPSLLSWAGGYGPVEIEKRPDPETQGTFGYESGVSGSDPKCHCDAQQVPTPAALLTLGLFALASLPRPRRRS